MAGAYKSFNRPTGKPMKVAGGSAFMSERKKSQSFANEAGTPGQSVTGMSSVGRGDEPGSKQSAATDTYTVRKAK